MIKLGMTKNFSKLFYFNEIIPLESHWSEKSRTVYIFFLSALDPSYCILILICRKTGVLVLDYIKIIRANVRESGLFTHLKMSEISV